MTQHLTFKVHMLSVIATKCWVRCIAWVRCLFHCNSSSIKENTGVTHGFYFASADACWSIRSATASAVIGYDVVHTAADGSSFNLGASVGPKAFSKLWNKLHKRRTVPTTHE